MVNFFKNCVAGAASLMIVGTLAFAQTGSVFTLGIGQQRLQVETRVFSADGLPQKQTDFNKIAGETFSIGFERFRSEKAFYRFFLEGSFAQQQFKIESANSYGDFSNEFRFRAVRGVVKLGIGKKIERDRLTFLFGPQLILGGNLPLTRNSISTSVDPSDSTMVSTHTDYRSPAALSFGIEAFIALRYRLGQRLHLGMEPRMGLYGVYVNGEIRTTTTTFNDASQITDEKKESRTSNRIYLGSPFWLGVPLFTISYAL